MRDTIRLSLPPCSQASPTAGTAPLRAAPLAMTLRSARSSPRPRRPAPPCSNSRPSAPSKLLSTFTAAAPRETSYSADTPTSGTTSAAHLPPLHRAFLLPPLPPHRRHPPPRLPPLNPRTRLLRCLLSPHLPHLPPRRACPLLLASHPHHPSPHWPLPLLGCRRSPRESLCCNGWS